MHWPSQQLMTTIGKATARRFLLLGLSLIWRGLRRNPDKAKTSHILTLKAKSETTQKSLLAYVPSIKQNLVTSAHPNQPNFQSYLI